MTSLPLWLDHSDGVNTGGKWKLVVSAKQHQFCHVQHLSCLRCAMHVEGRFGGSTQLLHLTLTAETLMAAERQQMGLCTAGRELVEGKQQAPRSERSAQEDSEPAGHCTTAQEDHHDPESCRTGTRIQFPKLLPEAAAS